MRGDITGLNGAAANTDLVKTGANKLTLTGTVSLAGDIIAQQGVLQLDGTADVETLRLDSSDAGAPASIGIGGNTTAQTLAAGTYGGTLDIGTSGTLTLTGATAALGNTAITGSGTLKLAQGSSLELAASSSMDGVLLELDGQLTANSDGNVQRPHGSGRPHAQRAQLQVNAPREPPTSMKARWEKERCRHRRRFQALRALRGDTDLNIDGGNLVLQGARGGHPTRAALTYAALENRGHLTIQASDNAISAFNTTLKVDGATFGSNSTTTFTLNSDGNLTESFIQSSGSIVVENGASFHVTTLPGINASPEPNLMEPGWNSTGTGDITLGTTRSR